MNRFVLTLCFRRAIENPGPGALRIIFADQHRFEPFLHQLSARPLDIGDAGVERLGDLAVAPTFTSVETSAFNRMRAFVSNCAECLPEPIKSVSFARSSALSRTTYFLTAISFPATNHLQRCSAAPVIQN